MRINTKNIQRVMMMMIITEASVILELIFLLRHKVPSSRNNVPNLNREVVLPAGIIYKVTGEDKKELQDLQRFLYNNYHLCQQYV